MWDPEQSDPQPSFLWPVAAPAAQPADSPTVCVPINVAWLPYVIGALSQLIQPMTWDGVGTSQGEMTGRATDLIDIFVSAGPCMQFAIRFSDGCTFQQSTDGGATWTTVPGWDTFYPDCITALIPPPTRLVVADAYNTPPITVMSDDGDDWIYHG